MPIRKKIAEKDGVYFITFTCTNWLPLFHLSNSYDAVYKWFEYLKLQGHYVAGYVITPNHTHALIAFTNSGTSINTIVAKWEAAMAYDIVKRVEEGKKILVLDEHQKGLNNTEGKEGHAASCRPKDKYGEVVNVSAFICDMLSLVMGCKWMATLISFVWTFCSF